MSVRGVTRGGLFLFAGYIAASVLGYVYWLIVSFLAGAEVVGVTSAVDNLSSLASGIAILGLPTGVKRFLGREFGLGNAERLKSYFWSSFTLSVILCLFSATFIWAVAFLKISFIGFTEIMLIACGLIAFLNFSGIFEALFTSIIKTEYIAISIVVSALVKLSLGVLLIRFGLGWVGAIMGIIFGSISSIALLLLFTMRELRHLKGIDVHVSITLLREPLHAGLVSWLPGIIALLGQQLGSLVVFGSQGSLEAGTFFIAYSIFSIIYMLPASFISILFPILSGLSDGAEEVAWRVLKLCLALAGPPTAFLTIYSAFPLSLMGGSYTQAASTLSLLSLSTIPLTFVGAVSSLAYAHGWYGKVLGMGLAVNIPRIVLYFVLVPMYGGFGAALSFLIGAILGLSTTIYVSKRASFRVSLRKITTAIAAPFVAGLLCFLLDLNWVFGGSIILLVSIFSYARLGVVEREDLGEIARGFASEKTVERVGERLSWLLRIIYGE